MLLLKDEFSGLSLVMQEVIVSVTIGSAALFALIGGVLNNQFGRKATIIFASFVFTAGAVCLASAVNVTMLIIGRLIVGAGIGLASMTVPMYIAECAPTHARGRLVTVNNLFITGGQFIASLIDGAFSYDKVNGWRYMLGLAAVPSIIQCVGFIFLPESPRWLMNKGDDVNAKAVLITIRGREDVQEEYMEIKWSIQQEEVQHHQHRGSYMLVRMLKTPAVRRALIVGCGLQMFQQISGINTVMYYSATIIQMAGVQGQSEAIWLAALAASCNFVFTIVGVFLVERIGRKRLIMGSLIGVILSLMLLAVGFQMAANDSPAITYHEDPQSPCNQYSICEQCIEQMSCGYCYTDTSSATYNGSCLPTSPSDPATSKYGRCAVNETSATWDYNFCPTQYSWLMILGLMSYLMCFAPGMGPMPWTINSEIYPTWARSTGNAIATATCWVFNLLVSMTFLSLTESITKYGTYWMYSGIAILGLVFMGTLLPETKGRSLEEMEALFSRPWSTCGESKHTSNTGDYRRLIMEEDEDSVENVR